MRKIKKYANRKMYDTTDKRYISLERLAELIKGGEEVLIVDNKSGEDLTASIVSQLLARDKPENDAKVPSSILIQLLRKGGGTVTDYAKKYASLWQSAFHLAEDEVDKLIKLLVKDKELSETEGRKLKKDMLGYADSLKTWLGEKIDQRIDEVLNVMRLASKDQVSELTERVDDLTHRLEKLEKASKESVAA